MNAVVESREKRVTAGVIGVLTAFGAFLTQYSSGSYQTTTGIVLLAAGSVIGGVAAALAVLGALRFGWVRARIAWLGGRIAQVPVRPLVVGAAVLALAAVATLLVVKLLSPLLFHAYYESFGCPAPTEFTVAVSDGQSAASQELVSAFEHSTAVDDYGCPTTRGFVVPLDEPTLVEGLTQAWGPTLGSSLNPLRDLGPRPDVWLAESTVPVDRVVAANPDVVRVGSRNYADSPLVLAVPAAVPRPATSTNGLPFQDLVRTQGAIGVVRPDPTVSTSAAIATAALYGVDDEGMASPPDPAAGDRTAEAELSRAASTESYPSGTEPETVCHYRSLSSPRAALLISEQSVLRYDAGLPLDQNCTTPARRPTVGRDLVPYFPRVSRLDHRLVRFSWTPVGSAADRAVTAFEDWLHSRDGTGALRAAGLRPATDSAPAPAVDAAVVDRTVLPRYDAARQPRRDLLAVDVSGSMTEADGSGTRHDAVVAAVTDALGRPRAADEVGLWFFPGNPNGAGPREAVPLGTSTEPVGGSTRAAAVISTVATTPPEGDTPLLRTIVDGVNALAATGDGAERRLVVVSDGEDTSSNLSPDAVLAAVRGRGVKVDIVTLGDVSCDAAPLRQVGDVTGGQCFDPGSTTKDLGTALEGG